MYVIEREMVETDTLLGGIEIVGAIGVILATFLVGGFSSDPLPWRVLAIFMGAAGLRRVR